MATRNDVYLGRVSVSENSELDRIQQVALVTIEGDVNTRTDVNLGKVYSNQGHPLDGVQLMLQVDESGQPVDVGTVDLSSVTGTLAVANGGTGTTTSTGSGKLVLDTSPTIVTPTIASFANATHTHQNAAGGGTLDAAAIAAGTLPVARGGTGTTTSTGTTNVVLSGSPTIVTPTIADLSNMNHTHQNAAGGGTLNAAAIAAGQLGIANGGTGASTAAAAYAAISPLQVVKLTSPVTINSGAANLATDITGLSFPVVSGRHYYFYVWIDFTTDATTTGSRWTVNGPGMTRIVYKSEYTLTGSTLTTNVHQTSLQLPAASNATSNGTGANYAMIEGFFTPSGNGTFQVQGAREVNAGGNQVVAQVGSSIQYTEQA